MDVRFFHDSGLVLNDLMVLVIELLVISGDSGCLDETGLFKNSTGVSTETRKFECQMSPTYSQYVIYLFVNAYMYTVC